MTHYEVAILGAGLAGSFAALKLAQQYPQLKTILIDMGAKPCKRKQQLSGFLGAAPGSDLKFGQDISQLSAVADKRRLNPAETFVMDTLQQFNPMKLIKDPLPAQKIQRKLIKNEFEIRTNNYYQWQPPSIHEMARYITKMISGVQFSFNNEVLSVQHRKKQFYLTTQQGEIICDRLLLCCGRNGFRWVTKLFHQLDIAQDDIAKFGIRVELAEDLLVDLNHSSCSFIRDNSRIFGCNLSVGPFIWDATIVPEDYADFANAGTRSGANENRWQSDKVNFTIMAEQKINNGIEALDRIAKLTHLLANDRVAKEKINKFVNGDSQLCYLPEYDWMIKILKEINYIIPGLVEKGSYYFPCVSTMASKISLKNNLETEIPGLYAAGETAGFVGLMQAAISGVVAAGAIAT